MKSNLTLPLICFFIALQVFFLPAEAIAQNDGETALRWAIQEGIAHPDATLGFFGSPTIGFYGGYFGHVWVVCRFQDGFELYNRFKSKRLRNGGFDVIEYFTHHGDCDSFFETSDGTRNRVCLPDDLPFLLHTHGQIIYIGTVDGPLTLKEKW